MAKVTSTTTSKDSNKLLVYVCATLVVVAAIIAGLELTNTTHFFHKNLGSGGIPSTSPTTPTKPKSSNSGDQTKTSVDNSTNVTTGGPPPLVPTGNFVSNHHPGGSRPTSEASTCNTTPGAVCYIQFTKGSVVKKLDPQTTGKDGGAIWYWDVKNAGLEAGSWKVTAVATLNGQTQTADDSLALEVQ